MPVAATFDFRSEDGVSLADVAKLDTMVTVVDAQAFLRDYGSVDACPTAARRPVRAMAACWWIC